MLGTGELELNHKTHGSRSSTYTVSGTTPTGAICTRICWRTSGGPAVGDRAAIPMVTVSGDGITLGPLYRVRTTTNRPSASVMGSTAEKPPTCWVGRCAVANSNVRLSLPRAV